MKMKIWGIIPITKTQLIIIETIFFTFFARELFLCQRKYGEILPEGKRAF